jgi:hypothetical protein
VQELAEVQRLLNVSRVQDLFVRRPLLIDSAAVAEALSELEATLPPKYDARRMLLEMPALIYPNNRKQLPQALVL